MLAMSGIPDSEQTTASSPEDSWSCLHLTRGDGQILMTQQKKGFGTRVTIVFFCITIVCVCVCVSVCVCMYVCVCVCVSSAHLA